jgi:signal transduction histidine kinase
MDFVASLVTYSDIKSEIGQVISNLLLNALEATQQGDCIAITFYRRGGAEELAIQGWTSD